MNTESPDHSKDTSEVNRPRTPEDLKDLEAARKAQPQRESKRSWLQMLGPGLITGAADDDPSGIGTYSQCGAAFGYGQLWLCPVCIPLMIAVQEMCGRVGLVTGKGIAAVLKENRYLPILYTCVGLLFLANTLNVYADLNVMAASAKMLFGLPQLLWLTLVTLVIGTLQVLVPYKRYSRLLKFSCIALASYVIVPFMKGSHNDWSQIFRYLFVPSWKTDFTYLLTAVGFLGTTISPYLFFWQASETVEEDIASGAADEPGRRKTRVKDSEIRVVRADTAVGMIVSQVAAFFIMVCTAGTLHQAGKTDINSATDAAAALAPLGPAAVWLFAIGIMGTGLLAVPTLAGSAAYAVAETFGWRYGLYRRFARAKGFYLTVIAVLLIGYVMNFFTQISPIKALVYSAVVNAIVAVPLIVVLLLICNNRSIMGERSNGKWSNFFGWLTFAFMGIASGFFIWAVLTGKAS